MDITTLDLDARISGKRHRHGSPDWHHLADSQRNADGLIVCPLDSRVWPVHLESEMEWDHVVPLDKDGPDTLRNGQLVCPSCNGAKGNLDNDEAIEYLASVRGLSLYERSKHMTEEQSDHRREYTRKWARTARGRMLRRRYNKSAKGLASLRARRRRDALGKPGGNLRLF